MPFQFNPVTGLNDASQFPAKDPLIRQHLQELLQQIPTYVDAQLPNKANKAMGTGYTATMQSGWTGTLYYSKNDLNQVHLRGSLVVGTITESTAIAQLPSGYYPPSYPVAIPIRKSSAAPLGTHLGAFVYTDGRILLRQPLIANITASETVDIDILFQV